MITLKITIDAVSYRQHIEQAEATDQEAIDKLRQDMTQALQTFRDYDFMVDAIRHHRDASLEIILYDSWVSLSEVDEGGEHPRRRHYEKGEK